MIFRRILRTGTSGIETVAHVGRTHPEAETQTVASSAGELTSPYYSSVSSAPTRLEESFKINPNFCKHFYEQLVPNTSFVVIFDLRRGDYLGNSLSVTSVRTCKFRHKCRGETTSPPINILPIRLSRLKNRNLKNHNDKS